MKVIIFGATGMAGQAALRECLRGEAVDSCRVKAAFNLWANGLFEFCRAAERFAWCLFHVFDRHQATRVARNYSFY
jgi:nucleoside-diphosphate-sugar epimerase